MTGALRTTMQTRADALDGFDLDLDAIVHAGDRRVRRRRNALVGGGAALALVAGGTAFGLHDRGTTAEPGPASDSAQPFTYAVGSVIHSGTSRFDVGVPVDSMVQTATGVVFADSQQRVYVEKDGSTHQVGRLSLAPTSLVVDDAGTTVAWVDGDRLEVYTGGGAPATSAPVQQPAGGDAAVALKAISGNTVWFWDGRGTMAYDLGSGQERHVAGYPDRDNLQDVSAGRMLVQIQDGSTGAGIGMSVLDQASRGGSAPPQVPEVYSGDLSPDGTHWFTQDADQFAVFDSATASRQDPSYKSLGFVFAAPYQWLDDDTMAVLALPSGSTDHPLISLLTCHVSTDACVVTASDIGDNTEVAIPVGQSLRRQ